MNPFVLKWLIRIYMNRYQIAAVIVSSGVVAFVLKVIKIQKRAKLTYLRKKKQEERRLAIQKLGVIISRSNMTDDRADAITSLELPDLLAQLRKGDLKATEVLHAYQLKALLCHQKTNCLVEPIFEAETWAAELDQLEDKEEKGPLHGLPVSIKDLVAIKGYDSTYGCSKWIGQPLAEDAVLVKVLKNQGAIPFMKTSVPQTMISWDSSNPIFGRVLNPLDLTRTPGGSSSGEGALIASGGSICGIGSDIGGSIRIPAALCGLCALKPTGNRISKKGRRGPLSGQNNVSGSWGPLARDVNGVIAIMKGLLVSDMYSLDPTIPIMPFRNEILEDDRKLKIGYFNYNGVFEVVPSVIRAVRETKVALESAGHQLVSWNPGDMLQEASAILSRSLLADAGLEFTETLRYDEVDPIMKTNYKLSKFPICLKKFLSFILKPFDPDYSSRCAYFCGLKNANAWWELVKQTKNLQTAVIESWQRNGFDGVICPVLASTAVTGGMPEKLSGVASYAGVFNVLDFPAGCVPVTKVTKADEDAMSRYPDYSSIHRILKKDLKGSVGLPVAVQVATLPWQDEMCLKIMSEIEKAIQNNS